MVIGYASMLRAWSEHHPDRPMFVVGDEPPLLARDWLEQATHLARTWDDVGVREDDRIHLQLDGSSWRQWLHASVAADLLGCVSVSTPVASPDHERAGLARRLGCTWNHSASGTHPSGVAGDPGRRTGGRFDRDDPFRLATVIFTSGTDGPWKPVFCEAGTLTAPWRGLGGADAQETHVSVASVPMSSAAAQSLIGQSLVPVNYADLGPPTVHILPRFEPNEFMRAVASSSARTVRVTPSQLRMLLRVDAPPAPSVKWVKVTGEASSPALLDRAQHLFPHARLSGVFGCAEAGRASLLVEHPFAPGALGSVNPGGEATVLSESGEEVGDDEVGELALRSLGASGHRYTEDAHACDPAVQPWIRTGDLVRRSGDMFFLVGRTKRVINVGGVKVSAERVEAVCSAVPGVQDAVCVAGVDHHLGERVLVAYVADEGDLASRVMRAAAADLEPAALPSRLLRVSEMPIAPSGKVDHDAVRELFELCDEGAARATAGADLVGEVMALAADVLPSGASAALSAADDLLAFGLDSLGALEFVTRVQERYGQELSPMDLLGDLHSCERIADWLAAVCHTTGRSHVPR